MREIKFRAWDKQGETGMHGENDNFALQCLEVLLEKPEQWAVMQFTGIKDKNGNEIYEGDILEYDFLPEGHDQRSEVVFTNGRFCIKDGNNYMPDGEVIGNIYENPELLKN